jgi:hypothetical protein
MDLPHDIPYEVAVNLGSATAGAALATAAVKVRRAVRYRSGRTFWEFLERPTVIVVGEMQSGVLLNTLDSALISSIPAESDRRPLVETITKHVGRQELSGLIGRGDYDSLVDMLIQFKALGLPFRHDVLHPMHVGARKTDNLILLGGTDVNPLTGTIGRRIGCQLEIAMNAAGRNAVRDNRLNSEYPVDDGSQVNARGEKVELDYGILARGRNPENPDSEVLIIAGAHGLGTWAATQVALNSEHQRAILRATKDYKSGVEALVRYERSGGPPEPHVTISLEWTRRGSAR